MKKNATLSRSQMCDNLNFNFDEAAELFGDETLDSMQMAQISGATCPFAYDAMEYGPGGLTIYYQYGDDYGGVGPDGHKNLAQVWAVCDYGPLFHNGNVFDAPTYVGTDANGLEVVMEIPGWQESVAYVVDYYWHG